MSGIVIELFAGPGGLSEGGRIIGLERHAGLELDAAACATRAAAGHHTIRADVSAFDVSRLAGRVTGLCGSPVCVMFSSAGTRAGLAIMSDLSDLIRDAFAGRRTRAARRRQMAATLRAANWPPSRSRSSRYCREHKMPVRLTREQRSAAIWPAVRSAALVAEPARYIAACRPEWIALEQVPDVLPLWEVYAAELRKMGYSAWCGVLNAADYGVPQTRQRAILIASRVRTVRRPEPTHYDPRRGMQLWGTPWISMADALGWGATGRPAPTTTAGGTRTGGAEPSCRRSREALEAERDAGAWALRVDAQAHATVRPATAPAPALKFGHSAAEMQWVRPNPSGHAAGYERETSRPSPTITSQVNLWSLSRGRGAGLTERWGERRNHPMDEPAPTITSAGSKPGANLAWVRERPATTVQGDPRIGRPGHKGYERGGESQFAVDSVRITPAEAAALQSFRPGYPFAGTKTKQFEQIGNSVPPLLGAAVLGEATGIEWQSRVAAYAELSRQEPAA